MVPTIIGTNDYELQYWWRKVKKMLQNLYNLNVIRARYIELQRQYRAGSEAGYAQCNKWFSRVQIIASYYARGGLEYKSDRDLSTIDLSQLSRSWTVVPIRSFEQLSAQCHRMNWIVFRGKQWVEEK